MTDNLPQRQSDILIYQAEDGRTHIEVCLENETVWLSQRLMAELFQKDVRTINEHIKNIYEDREFDPEATIRKFRIVQTEGNREVSRTIDFYNLDMILAVGYRVRSHRGVQFRRWATERLREYLVKGFVMDDERLKNMRTPFGADYFDELLDRIRDIRASEKRFYRKITDIYATSVDYDPNADISRTFFATVQNKLHYAIHGQTAAELIAARADASQPHMSLTSWKGAKVRKTDVTIAKNYLTKEELSSLNRIVTMYLDYAEDQAQRRRPMQMREWADRLDAFLTFNDREVLDSPGKVAHAVAERLALEEYDKFNARRLAEEAARPDEEFDQVVRKIESAPKRKK